MITRNEPYKPIGGSNFNELLPVCVASNLTGSKIVIAMDVERVNSGFMLWMERSKY